MLSYSFTIQEFVLRNAIIIIINVTIFLGKINLENHLDLWEKVEERIRGGNYQYTQITINFLFLSLRR